WHAIEPIGAATGPLDPAIPSVPIVAVQLGALGWCAPAYGSDRPIGPVSVRAWIVIGGRATDLQLEQGRPTAGVTPIAPLYLPLTLCPESTVCASLLPPPER